MTAISPLARGRVKVTFPRIMPDWALNLLGELRFLIELCHRLFLSTAETRKEAFSFYFIFFFVNNYLGSLHSPETLLKL